MITVNAMGDACPIPVIKTKKALEENKGQDTVEVLVDNETAVKNVTKMAELWDAIKIYRFKREIDRRYYAVIGKNYNRKSYKCICNSTRVV